MRSRTNKFSPFWEYLGVNGKNERSYQVEQQSYYHYTDYIDKDACFGHFGYLDAPATENNGVGRSCHRHHEGAGG